MTIQSWTMAECSRCGLQWRYQDEINCPKCVQYMSALAAPVIVAGFEVNVERLILHGEEVGLLDKRVRRGLDKLDLFERCGCGYVSWRICPKCYKRNMLQSE